MDNSFDKVISSPIRWAGSKKKLLNEMLEWTFVRDKDNYIEPFLGSGVILINVLKNNIILKYKNFYVNDINENIINFYIFIRDNIEEYQKAILDLMDFDFHKRETARQARESLFVIIEHLQIMLENPDSKYTVKMAIESLQSNFESLAKVEGKYDYKKIPKDM